MARKPVAQGLIGLSLVWLWMGITVFAQQGNGNHRPIVRPHIILINLDDADRDLVEIDLRHPRSELRLPTITKLAREGRRFSNCHVTSPLCAPSRACLLTGQYAHQTRVMTNDPHLPRSRGVTGNFQTFHRRGPHGSPDNVFWENDLGCWMKQCGYHTMFVGKYLHGGYEPRSANVPSWRELQPPGWNDFLATLGGDYFRAPLVRNGHFVDLRAPAGAKDEITYRTTREGRDVQRLIRRHVTTDATPFFMYWAPFAPHREAAETADVLDQLHDRGMVEPQYRQLWNDERQPLSPAFDLLDLTGKPTTIQQLPRLAGRIVEHQYDEVDYMDLLFRRRLRAMRSVDDMLAEILELLEALRIADRTLIVITSDNGYHLGQHRVYGKATPYRWSTNVPAIFWGPAWFDSIAEPLDHLLAHIDLAPTFVELAGGKVPHAVQGKSLVPLLSADPPPAESWRPEGILVEQWELTPCRGHLLTTTFCSLRLHREVYTQWSSGDREYYRLEVDPDELNNAIGELSPQREQQLQRQIAALRAGIPHPLTFIEQGELRHQEAPSSFVVQGIADYHSPIQAVEITVSEQELGFPRYWDGAAWSRHPTSLQAELANADGIITDWSCRLEIPAKSPLPISITACALGHDGIRDGRPASRELTILGDKPWCLMLRPAPGEAVQLDSSGVITISGWAEDESRVRAVRLVIADRHNNLFWDGQSWVTETKSVITELARTPGDLRVAWSYEFYPGKPRGEVEVIARVLSRDRGQAVRGSSRIIRWEPRP